MPTAQIKDLTINYEVSGDESAEPVLLVHGFPDSLKLWRHVAPKLADAGYRVIAIDLPGYGDSSIPKDVKEMRVDNIGNIIAEFLDSLSISKVHLIGHDWGAAVSWFFAGAHPDYIKSFTALSVGHPKSYLSAGPEQILKAWYIVLILNEGLAEDLYTADNWSLFKNFLGHGLPLDQYWLSDMQREGRLTAAFNIYRANLMPGDDTSPMKDAASVKSDVLAIFGEDDLSLSYKQMKDSEQYVEGDFKLKSIPKAHHWLPLHNADEITPWIVEFLNEQSKKA